MSLAAAFMNGAASETFAKIRTQYMLDYVPELCSPVVRTSFPTKTPAVLSNCCYPLALPGISNSVVKSHLKLVQDLFISSELGLIP